MDAQTFMAEFAHIANAPDGIARLRDLVIQLAISGRIVERIDGFSSVRDTLIEAAAQKGAYQAELGLRAAATLPTLKEFLFQIPAHWEWARLEQISLYIQRGKGPCMLRTGPCMSFLKSVSNGVDLIWGQQDLCPTTH
jgi:type I restriction enzyme, S subunit